MWVKMRNMASGPNFCYDVGQVADVDEKTGKLWVEAGYAEKVSAPSQPSAHPGIETASVDPGENAADQSLINRLRGGNAKPKAGPADKS